MKTFLHTRFSWAEYIGITLMIVGLGAGYFTSISSARLAAEDARTSLEYWDGVGDLHSLKEFMVRSQQRLGRSQTMAEIGSISFWIFLTGLAGFVVSRRARYNRVGE